MRISACLIVRNEEKFLDNGLSSLAGVIDELVIVDTGSTDRSRQIALDHGAVLIDEPWRDDFAWARNLGLQKATGDWILYIDADEVLQAKPEDLVGLDDPQAVAATVSFRPASHLTCYREYRLFRNRPDIRFKGVIHETVRPAVDKLIEVENGRVVHTGAHIEHLGYEGDLTRKHLRNRPMLLKSVEEWPGRVYLWHALGECEWGLEHYQEAEAAWRTGLKLVRKMVKDPRHALIYHNLFALHFHPDAQPLADITELSEEALQCHGEDPLVQWWTARLLLQNRDPASARKFLLGLLEADLQQANPTPLAYDRKLFSSLSQALLGSCAMLEGDANEAAGWFDRALINDPDNREIRLKRDYALASSSG